MSSVLAYFFNVYFCLFMVLNIFYNKNKQLSIKYKKNKARKIITYADFFMCFYRIAFN